VFREFILLVDSRTFRVFDFNLKDGWKKLM